jgi:hypothetical protein
MLDQAPALVKARFALLLARSAQAEAELTASSSRENEATAAAELRLASDPHIGAALAWLDQHSEWTSGASRRKAASRLRLSMSAHFRIVDIDEGTSNSGRLPEHYRTTTPRMTESTAPTEPRVTAAMPSRLAF